MTSREAVTRRENWKVKGNCFRHVSQKSTLNSSAFTVTTFTYSQCWVTVKILVSETFGITRLHTWVDSHSRVYTTRFKRQHTDVLTQRDVTHVMSLMSCHSSWDWSSQFPPRSQTELRLSFARTVYLYWSIFGKLRDRCTYDFYTHVCVCLYIHPHGVIFTTESEYNVKMPRQSQCFQIRLAMAMISAYKYFLYCKDQDSSPIEQEHAHNTNPMSLSMEVFSHVFVSYDQLFGLEKV